eukprot:g21819.t1
MAPESWLHGTYSRASDVFMFGVFLWEAFTRDEPYPDDHARAANLVATQGVRPIIPHFVPQGYVEIMKKCWHAVPDQRPSIKQIHAWLQAEHKRMSSISMSMPVSAAAPAAAAASATVVEGKKKNCGHAGSCGCKNAQGVVPSAAAEKETVEKETVEFSNLAPPGRWEPEQVCA